MGAIAQDWMAMVAVSDKPARRPFVDFAAVPPSQWRMHDRLENWARWAHGDSGASARTEAGSPMFRLYKSTEAKRQYGEETAVPIDKQDAQAVAKGIAFLPDKQRRAIHWCYLHPRNPASVARELVAASDLGKSLQGLADLVREGRQILINRGV